MSRSVKTLIPLLVIVSALFISGCGTKTSNGPATKVVHATADSKLAAEVPKAIRDKGTLTVASDPTYAPNEFVDADGKTIIGMDADLATALGDVLKLKVTVTSATFDSIIPGLAAGKYDLGMSSFTDSKEREKVVSFVTYFEAGTSFYALSSGPDIKGLDDLCGHLVAVERGTVQADDSKAQSKKCTDAGKKPVNVSVYPDQNAANLAITSGRAEIGMADSPVTAYIAKQSGGKFKLTGKAYNTAPYGVAVSKNSGMDKPVLDALKLLMANGKYDQILKKWNTQDGAVKNPVINGATS